MHQIIKEPAHTLDTSSLNIELILRSEPNLIIKLGIHWFLLSHFNHQIIHEKFNLEIIYTPLYVRDVRRYENGNAELVRKLMN